MVVMAIAKSFESCRTAGFTFTLYHAVWWPNKYKKMHLFLRELLVK